VQNTEEEHGGTKTTPAATAAHTRYLSSPAAATLPGKTPGFVLRLPPHNTEHATFMQPFQCDLQPQSQGTHIELRTQEQPLGAEHRGGTKTTPAATAAHTRYLSSPAAATLHGKTQGFVRRLPPHNTEHATFMQPFQCDLQPQIQETHIEHAHRNNHPLQNTEEEPAPAATAAHIRPASSPQQRACNIHAAIPMRSATADSRNI